MNNPQLCPLKNLSDKNLPQRVPTSAASHGDPTNSFEVGSQNVPGVSRGPVQFIEESDIRKICFHELFLQHSCRRVGCTFSHDFPSELRTCGPLINKVKGIQAAIKKKKLAATRVNRF